MTGTAFERAVIGALVLISHEAGSDDSPARFTDQELGAAERAIAPFLDETPNGADPVAIVDAAIGDTPYAHRHAWIIHELPNGAKLAACAVPGCFAGTQLV